MERNDFIEWERIQKIKQILNEYDVNKMYVSHSGGKDSVVLSKLIDLALPGNNIPRVCKFNGIEFPQMREFVRTLANKDKRFIILEPSANIKQTLVKYGYPFKSKQHTHNWLIFKNNMGKCLYYKSKLLNAKADLIERVKQGKATRGDVKYIDSLPSGVKTFVKYYFGLRIKKIRYVVNGKERERTYAYIYEKCP